MNYPTIYEYKEAILFAEDNFEQLKNLRPVLDEEGNPVMTSGNFAVVFKMKDEKTRKLHAVKCFLREQEGRAEAYRMIAEELKYVSSTFLTPIKYLEKEFFVDTNAGEEKEFPVLLMDWVEGETLDKYIVHNKYDGYKLSCLCRNFHNLSKWLLSQPFAHGDLKPDNILVKSDDTLVLVDYDGMYVPQMFGQKPREHGSPNYRNPYTGDLNSMFSKRIDDFSIIHILLSLRVYSLCPQLITKNKDFALFNYDEFHNISETSTYQDILWSCSDGEISLLMMLFQKIISLGIISKEDWDMLHFEEKERNYINMEEQMCSLDNIIQAVNLAYSSMKYKDPARNEYELNEYRDYTQRICLATMIQEDLSNHEWPYDIHGIKYSRYKPNGIEKREGVVYDLKQYALRYLFGIVKYQTVKEYISSNIFGGASDVFLQNINEEKYESFLEDFVEEQELCAQQYRYLYVFDIRDFFKSVDDTILKDLYWGKDFCNVEWFDDLYSTVFNSDIILGLNPCSEVDFFFANLYLKSLDKAMIQYDGIKYYRYCDDIRIFANDDNLQDSLSNVISSILSPLSLELNKNKTKLIDTQKDLIELSKACFVYSCRLYLGVGDDCTVLVKSKSLAEIIEHDLTTSYIYRLLKKWDLPVGDYEKTDEYLNNLFYILKNVHKNATLYRNVLMLIFESGLWEGQDMLAFSGILKRIVEVLKDDTIESFVKYWIIRTYYCSDKQFYKQYLEKEKKWIGQYYWPKPCYNDQIVEMLNIKFRTKGSDGLLCHISDFIISYIEPEELNDSPSPQETTTTFKTSIETDDLPF